MKNQKIVPEYILLTNGFTNDKDKEIYINDLIKVKVKKVLDKYENYFVVDIKQIVIKQGLLMTFILEECN